MFWIQKKTNSNKEILLWQWSGPYNYCLLQFSFEKISGACLNPFMYLIQVIPFSPVVYSTGGDQLDLNLCFKKNLTGLCQTLRMQGITQ